MVNPVLPPDYDLARRLDRMERQLNATRINPLLTDSAGTSQVNFAVGVAPVALAQQTVTVPDGYTTCLVFSGVSIGAFNNTAAAAYLYVAASINGAASAETPTSTPASGYGSGSGFAIKTITGLSGGSTVTVEAQVRSSAGAWSANAANTANTSALFFFFR